MLIDVVGLAGLCCLVVGVYVQFGTGPSLMVGGRLLLAFALRAATRGRK